MLPARDPRTTAPSARARGDDLMEAFDRFRKEERQREDSLPDALAQLALKTAGSAPEQRRTEGGAKSRFMANWP